MVRWHAEMYNMYKEKLCRLAYDGVCKLELDSIFWTRK